MSDDRYYPDEFTDWPDLVARLALVLGEHMADGDELHVTYNAMQSGFQHFPPQRDGSQWTDLHFEYSAFVVLRPRPAPPLE